MTALPRRVLLLLVASVLDLALTLRSTSTVANSDSTSPGLGTDRPPFCLIDDRSLLPDLYQLVIKV